MKTRNSPADTPQLPLPRRWLPNRWALWSQRRQVVAFVLAVEAITVLVAAFTIATIPVGDEQWWRFGLLTLCAVAHLRASQRVERERRDRSMSPHIDLTSVWSFAAVLTLHPALSLLLIGVLRVDRWFVARRPPFRFLFSAASHVLSTMLATSVLHQLDQHPLASNCTAPSPRSQW